MHRLLFFIILPLLIGSCSKNESTIEQFHHSAPEFADRNRNGAVIVKNPKRDWAYFSHSVFPNFPTDFWLYDSISSQWVPRADFPGKDRLLPIMLIYNDQLFSGLSKVQPQFELNDWFSYDIQKDRWDSRSSCPYLLPAAMTASKSGANILIGCEYPLSDIPLCHFVYQVTGNSWRKSSPPCDSISRSCY